MLGIFPKRTLLILCPLNITPVLSGMWCYHKHYTDEETETQDTYLPFPMSHIYSGRKLDTNIGFCYHQSYLCFKSIIHAHFQEDHSPSPIF